MKRNLITLLAALFMAAWALPIVAQVDISTIAAGEFGAGWSFDGTKLSVTGDITLTGTASGRYVEVAAGTPYAKRCGHHRPERG